MAGTTIDIETLISPDRMGAEIADRWRPYRSYAALYLWEFSDNRPR